MKIVIRPDTSEARALAGRAQRMKPSSAPIRLDPLTSVVQFLRGVNSRATMSLPAFYLFLGSNVEAEGACRVLGYPGAVLTHWTRFSAINTITLSCRKVFDHAAGGLTAAALTKSSDATLAKAADYYANRANRDQGEAWAALLLLREVFRECARPSAALLGGGSTLGKRVGLLKQHADRSAAHLSLDSYEFSPVDCAHVVGAMTLLGEVVRTFDDATAGPSYFNQLDEASLAAAKDVFPMTPDLRLFGHIDIANQAAWCWKDRSTGKQMLLEQLPYAMGWF